jgi:hypothetical protein
MLKKISELVEKWERKIVLKNCAIFAIFCRIIIGIPIQEPNNKY